MCNYLWIHLERNRVQTSLQYFSAASQTNETWNLRAVGLRWWHRLYWVSFLCKQSLKWLWGGKKAFTNVQKTQSRPLLVGKDQLPAYFSPQCLCQHNQMSQEKVSRGISNRTLCHWPCAVSVCVYVEILWWCFLSKTNGRCFAVTRSSITRKLPSALWWCKTSGEWIVGADDWTEAAPNPDQVISTQHSSSRVLQPLCSAFLLLFCSVCCCLTEFCQPTTSVTSARGLCLYRPLWGLATSFAVISIWQIIYLLQNIFVLTRKEYI